ncbi:hypothetical protein ACWDA3_27555 [Nonomuraea rubra]
MLVAEHPGRGIVGTLIAYRLNERIRTTWFDPAGSEALSHAPDALLSDLK